MSNFSTKLKKLWRAAVWIIRRYWRGWSKQLRERVHGPHDSQLVDSVRHVAIAIRATDSTQRHLGILHRDDDTGKLKLLELQWHFRLRNDDADPDDTWVAPCVPDIRLQQVAARCRQVARANVGSIPYGFSQPWQCFNEQTARYMLGTDTLGLTCASFVLAVFNFARVPLIDPTTWRSRPDDVEWQRKIVAMLRKYKASEAHCAAVAKEVGCARFRPEEAAAGALAPPMRFELAEPLGQEIVRILPPAREN